MPKKARCTNWRGAQKPVTERGAYLCSPRSDRFSPTAMVATPGIIKIEARKAGDNAPMAVIESGPRRR